jgi:hypothetical protein
VNVKVDGMALVDVLEGTGDEEVIKYLRSQGAGKRKSMKARRKSSSTKKKSSKKTSKKKSERGR